SLLFDLRGVKPPSVASLLAGLTQMSHSKRRAYAAELESLRRGAAEYAELTRGVEDAQRWLLDRLTALDPELISNREISPVPEGWPTDLPDDAAAHRATLAPPIEGGHP